MRISQRWFVPAGYLLCFALGLEIGGYQALLYNMAEDFGLSGTQMGLLVTVLYSATIVTPLLVGPLTDRISKKKSVSIFTVVFIAGCILIALSASPVILVFGILLIGGATSLLMGTIIAALAAENPQKSNRYSNQSMMLVGAGAVIAPLIVNRIINEGLDWRFHFAVVSLFSAAVVLIWMLIRIEHKESFIHHAEATHTEEKSLKVILSASFILLLIAMVLYFMIDTGIQSFIKAFFISELDDPVLGSLGVSLIWIGTIPARLIASFIHKNKKLLVICCLAADALLIFIMATFKVPAVAVACSLLLGVSSGPLFPTIMSITIDLYPQNTGLASNFMMSATGVGGAAAGALVGAAVDYAGFSYAFYMIMGIAIGALVAFIAALILRQKQLAVEVRSVSV